MTIKICSVCKEKLDLSEFNKDKSAKDGLQRKCKKCIREYAKRNKERIKVYQDSYRKENKDKAKEYNEIYRIKNTAILKVKQSEKFQKYKHKYLLKSKEYYQKNKDRHSMMSKIRYEKNKDKISHYHKEYVKKNKDKVSLWSRKGCHKRRAMKKSLLSTLTKEQWLETLDLFDNKCCYCGRQNKLEQEHFIPISKGGNYTKDNIIPACRSCNSSKQNKDFFEWYPYHESYSVDRKEKILNFLNHQTVEGGEKK